MATTTSASFTRLYIPAKPQFLIFTSPFQTKPPSSRTRFTCSAGETGLFTKLGRLLKEKAKSDVEKLFSGFSKTRNNLSVIDELLLYWNLSDTDRVLDELEEVRFRFRSSYSIPNYYYYFFN